MFNELFIIWYFLTILIMGAGCCIFKIIENIKEVKRLNAELLELEKILYISKVENFENKQIINDLNDTIEILKK